MNTTRLASVLLSATMMWGCSTLTQSPGDVTSDAYSSAAPLPAWTQVSSGETGTSVWFVGQAEASSEAKARSQAENHAVGHLVRYLGADVRVSELSLSETQTGTDGIAREQISSLNAVGLSGDAHSSGGTYSYLTRNNNGTYIVWARYELSREQFRRAQKATNSSYKQRIERLAEARKLAERSRYTDIEGLRFAMVTGEAVSAFNPSRPAQSESQAVAKAKNAATMKIVETLLGQTLQAERHGAVTYLSGSSQGRVFHEEISTRVWVLGSEVKAETTILGWTPTP
ncbi:hypothetical protein [Marinobacter sp. P4B1]|uniref:hypothetical protein n=1 Tax=Marinobacter sp. P4B1 TaxID=1119533 RepID=UPI00071DE372|nr:hypothetical protein [Marinobacter sp. P4B1]KRW83636.1 hypothetical protein AQ621_16440 [Marinobacter sp. P4B1]